MKINEAKTRAQAMEQMERIMARTARDARGYEQHVPRTSKYRHGAYYRVRSAWSQLKWGGE